MPAVTRHGRPPPATSRQRRSRDESPARPNLAIVPADTGMHTVRGVRMSESVALPVRPRAAAGGACRFRVTVTVPGRPSRTPGPGPTGGGSAAWRTRRPLSPSRPGERRT